MLGRTPSLFGKSESALRHFLPSPQLLRCVRFPASHQRHINTSAIRQAYPRFPPLPNHLPPPAPREYNADGTPRKYRLMQWTYDHPYNWERWTFAYQGPFHTMYFAEFAKEMSWYRAWFASFPIFAMVAMSLFIFASIASLAFNGGAIGIKPKRYTIEWMEAMKERDRVENSNPITRYLERRRKERGANWLPVDVLPKHKYFLWMRNKHDMELLRKREQQAQKILAQPSDDDDGDDDDASSAEDEE